MSARRALVINPTYNEAENIGSLIDQILEQAPEGTDVLVVDDSSKDGTADVVRGRMKAHPDRVFLKERPGKMGLGTAYLAGFEEAMSRGYEFAITMDADHSHNPAHLVEMLHMAQMADVVVGSRYIAGGGIRNWGFHRHILSWGANTLARFIVGLNARDCTSGYRCYRTELLRQIDFAGIRSHGYSCLMELLAVCQKRGARIREIPIIFHDRRAGKSKISSREIAKAFATLYRLRGRAAKAPE